MKALVRDSQGSIKWRTDLEYPAGQVRIEFEAALVDPLTLRTFREHGEPYEIDHQRIPGWSRVGRIVSLENEPAGLAVGQRVAIFNSLVCGKCPACQAGNPAACSGRGNAFAETGSFCSSPATDAAAVYPVPDGMTASRAAFAGELARLYRVVDIARDNCEAFEIAAVIGLGLAGIQAIKMLLDLGFDRVVGVDPCMIRREQATRHGATMVFGPGEYVAWVADDRQTRTHDLAIVTSAAQESFSTALLVAGTRAIVLVLETPVSDCLTLDHVLRTVIHKELLVQGVFWLRREDISRAMKELASGADIFSEEIEAIPFDATCIQRLNNAAASSPSGCCMLIADASTA